jgi:putative transposase
MARMARAIAPRIAHHITQRGNRRQQFFFNDEDYQACLEFMSQWCTKFKVEAGACCLVPNHVHWMVVPETKDGLTLAIGEAHRRYTRRISFREGWGGHLWQRTGRPMGADAFIEKLEQFLDRKLKQQKPGPKKKDK